MNGFASPAGDAGANATERGIGLCLSGGGYRAMLFHAGALWRLNEAGWLPRLARVSSVSGGSIAAAVLGDAWRRLKFDAATGEARAFATEVVAPLRRLAGTTIDVRAVALGVLLPGTAAGRVAAAYRTHLFGRRTLQDLPLTPRFVINATNVQSAALWRFARPYMRDYRVGEVREPAVELADAVAASSAFPPFLSPARLKLAEQAYTPGSGADLQFPPYTTNVFLTDGGVYDNLGIEAVWGKFETVLVSDGGGHIADQPKPSRLWPLHAYRILGVIDNQVRNLRKREILGDLATKRANGAYWGIRTDIAEYGLPSAVPCPHATSLQLALVSTRLARLDPSVQQRLINWGYAVSDAALRTDADPGLDEPVGLPYPAAGFGPP